MSPGWEHHASRRSPAVSALAAGSPRKRSLSDLTAHKIEEQCAVLVIAKDVLTRIPARGDVIQRSGELQMQRTGHAEMLTRISYNVKR